VFDAFNDVAIIARMKRSKIPPDVAHLVADCDRVAGIEDGGGWQ
jgi:hypothetical protein